MVSEAPHTRDLFEVEEPTQPFSRADIARMRRFADDPETPDEASAQAQLTVVPSDEPPSAAVNDEPARETDGMFELDGRWIRVSLEPFAAFGMNGTPPGMIGSLDLCFVSGVINALDGPDSVPTAPLPRLTEVHQAAEPEPEPTPEPEQEPSSDSPRKARWLWAVAGVALLAMPVVVWAVAESRGGVAQPESSEAVAEGEPPAVIIVAPVPEAPKDEFVVEDAPEEDVLITYNDVKAEEKPHKSQECVQRRKQAERARESGSWVELELLARVGKCWPKASEAKALRMRALFELERFEECVQLGAQASSQEVKKWVSNCQRALD